MFSISSPSSRDAQSTQKKEWDQTSLAKFVWGGKGERHTTEDASTTFCQKQVTHLRIMIMPWVSIMTSRYLSKSQTSGGGQLHSSPHSYEAMWLCCPRAQQPTWMKQDLNRHPLCLWDNPLYLLRHSHPKQKNPAPRQSSTILSESLTDGQFSFNYVDGKDIYEDWIQVQSADVWLNIFALQTKESRLSRKTWTRASGSLLS